MFKKSPSRNQRSKGIKIKHVLQICLLLGVCFWLIYQVKHSHDKRKEFDEKDAKGSVKTQSDDVIVKFGRKDLPRIEVSKNHKHEEEEEEENGVEEENKHDEEQEEKAKSLEEEEQGASKHEEDEQEEASKHEEEKQDEASKHDEEEQEETSKHEEEEQEEEGGKHDDEEQETEIKDEETEDEGRGVGDDEVDENEQERPDGEAEHEEEFMEEEKERDAEGDDKENEEKENEEKEGQDESDNSANDANDQNDDGGGRNAHEAREEHYKADDASSAVSHDTQIISSETERFDTENSTDNSTMNASEQESRANTTEETSGDEKKSDLKVDEVKHSEGGSSSNVTYTKENDHETVSSSSENISLPNTTNTAEFIDRASSNSTEASKETGNKHEEENTEMPVSLQNGTATVDVRVTKEKYKEQANETISNSVQSDSNTVDSSKLQNIDSATRESSDSSTNAESGMTEDITKVNATAGGDSFGSSHIKESTDSSQSQKSDGDNESGGTDESSDGSSSNVTVDEGQHDPIDSSDNTLPQEEKDARVDLSTLPDIRTEGSNIEDAAAE